jgi:hypothetical protein
LPSFAASLSKARAVRRYEGTSLKVVELVVFVAIGDATPNPSIERTPYGTLRVPPVAAHVER